MSFFRAFSGGQEPSSNPESITGVDIIDPDPQLTNVDPKYCFKKNTFVGRAYGGLRRILGSKHVFAKLVSESQPLKKLSKWKSRREYRQQDRWQLMGREAGNVL